VPAVFYLKLPGVKKKNAFLPQANFHYRIAVQMLNLQAQGNALGYPIPPLGAGTPERAIYPVTLRQKLRAVSSTCPSGHAQKLRIFDSPGVVRPVGLTLP
jgi:hypothetical protein